MFSKTRIVHVPLNIVNTLAYLYSSIPVISTVTSTSGGTCVELSTTRSKVPHHTYTWWGAPLESMGSPLEFSLRLVLGDEDVSGALVIDIVTDHIQYSCYHVFPLYAQSCWHPAHGVWN